MITIAIGKLNSSRTVNTRASLLYWKGGGIHVSEK